jgi:hypothetical protein
MEYSLIIIAETETFQRKGGRLLTGNEKANISIVEKNVLAKAVKELVNYWRLR